VRLVVVQDQLNSMIREPIANTQTPLVVLAVVEAGQFI
jgi:hypothetical protein